MQPWEGRALPRTQPYSDKRILYVVTRAERGGAQSHVLELLRGAAGRYAVALACGETGFLTREAQARGVAVFHLTQLAAPLNPWKDLWALLQMALVIHRFKPDLIHAHSSKAGLLARIAARLFAIPCIFTAHGWAFSTGASLLHRSIAMPAEWLAGRLGSSTIAVSQFDHDLALRFGITHPSRISTISNGISDDPGRACPEGGFPPVITMVARFTAQKDHLTLLRALSKVRAPFRLQFLGDGPLMEQSRACAEQLGLTNRTDFLGDCESVRELLPTTHVFALISRYEGLPISILEAMCAGLPIVATDTGGVSEAVRQGWNGLLVGRASENTLRDALESLLADPAMRKSFGRHSRTLFEEAFTADAMVRSTMEIYDRKMIEALHPGPIKGAVENNVTQTSNRRRSSTFDL
jgi:glycosyltransferase involved in cell wall biosynthesis